MKKKLNYIAIPFVLFLALLGVLGSKTAEAAAETVTETPSSWKVVTENNQSNNEDLSMIQKRGLLSKERFDRNCVPVGKAGLQIIKYDSRTKARLQGAQFTIYDRYDRVVQVIETNAYGVAQTNTLPLGTYKIIETKAPQGYQLESTPIRINLFASGKIFCLTKENVPLPSEKGNLSIIKTGENGQVLAGAEFDVFDSKNQFVGRVTTNEKGVATLTNLPFGLYKLVEVKAPDGYELDKTPHYINISKNSPNGVESITVINKKQKTTGILEIHKKNEAGNVLAGAEFDVYDSENKLVKKVTTDVNGRASLENLPFGKYKIIETKAPDGYQLDETPLYVTVSEDDPNGKAVIEFTNKKIILPQTGSLKIIKYVKDSVPEIRLPGATFGLYNEQQVLIGTYTTDENGEILVSDLQPGKYYVAETQAPPGYEEDITRYEITVEAGKIAEIRHSNIKKEDLGSLKIKKYIKNADGFETTNPLADAKFEVIDAQGNVYEGVTDKNGEALFTNLAVGESKIKETEAPKGYELD